MVATVTMLSKPDVVQYVGQNAYRYNLDPAAVLAVANHEGLNKQPVGGVAPTWILPNEGGLSNFGPPSWFQGGAGGKIIQQQGGLQAAANWSWTPAGLDYWMQSIADAGAGGLQGLAAVTAIVQRFENPRADLIPGEITNAMQDYQSFQQQIITGGGNTIVVPPSQPGDITGIPGQTTPGQLPAASNPQAQTTVKATPFSMHLLDLPTGPVNLTLPWDFSGILLFLAALLAIIIGALLWDKSRTVIINSAAVAA